MLQLPQLLNQKANLLSFRRFFSGNLITGFHAIIKTIGNSYAKMSRVLVTSCPVTTIETVVKCKALQNKLGMFLDPCSTLALEA